MANLKELATRRELLAPGHRLCAGCGAPTAVRQIMLALPPEAEAVVTCATGCLEVSTTIYPYSSWRCGYLHNAFENAAATASGLETMYQVKKAKGEIDRDIRFIAFGGDGGTYDIGFQSLSGALERGHHFIAVCYDNEAYMNTGIQRSGSTPMGAWTTTSPVGKASFGKAQARKNLTFIAAEHNVVYAAQMSISHYSDTIAKAEKAWEYSKEGPVFLNILAPCHRGWRFPMEKTIEMARLAVQTRFWPLFEVEKGEWRLTQKVSRPKPIEEWLKPQGRFRHLFTPENEHVIKEIQAQVDRDWERLMQRCGEV
ncbi:MAG: pyruvate ferredoxin oxidoreductase [Clostridia bacterium]|nr:pyruvate ferredoxin oxidoreductase [Clostridia bacterium]